MALGNTKSKRIVDRALLDFISSIPCLICGKPGPSDPHHIKHKGSGGNDTVDNLVSFCRKHHSELHQIGIGRFANKYPVFIDWLRKADRQDILSRINDFAEKVLRRTLK